MYMISWSCTCRIANCRCSVSAEVLHQDVSGVATLETLHFHNGNSLTGDIRLAAALGKLSTLKALKIPEWSALKMTPSN